MDKQRKEALIAAALVALFVLSLARHLFFEKKKPSAMTRAAAATVSPTDTVGNLAALTALRQNFRLLSSQEGVWREGWGRDPFFQQQSAALGTLGSIVLSGIVYDQKMPIVMVNEQVLTVGDQIQGYTVKQIKPSSVIFTANGQDFEVRLFEAAEKPNSK